MWDEYAALKWWSPKWLRARIDELETRLATAERELDQSREEADSYLTDLDNAHRWAAERQKKTERLQRERDEARKDSERLDVLDQEFSYYVRDSDAGDLSWRSVDFSADVTGIKDLRAGIDRSIERSPGQDAAREGGEDES